jgi:hypothetical protein
LTLVPYSLIRASICFDLLRCHGLSSSAGPDSPATGGEMIVAESTSTMTAGRTGGGAGPVPELLTQSFRPSRSS